MVQIEEDVREKVKNLLRELFQFDNQDLDFGIYRIMNFKRKEIEKFIEQDLIAETQKQVSEFSQAGQEDSELKLRNSRLRSLEILGQELLNEHGQVMKNEDAPKLSNIRKNCGARKRSSFKSTDDRDIQSHL